MNKTGLIVLLVLVGGGLVYWLGRGGTDGNGSRIEPNQVNEVSEQVGSDENEVGEAMMGEETISYSDAGFSPQTVTVKAGTKVRFVNESSKEMWPATAVHPTHTVYPGSSISKCGTAEAATIFDACRGMAPGGSYSFTFDEVGDWKYHNHLTPTHFGGVVVE
ncbi:MAG: hypothetical protein HYS86_01460 [Candidatus Chisholmbacteria bacterium]|nr:hypothetical protein [Candidatus Chisholmbacteria bacterium]